MKGVITDDKKPLYLSAMEKADLGTLGHLEGVLCGMQLARQARASNKVLQEIGLEVVCSFCNLGENVRKEIAASYTHPVTQLWRQYAN